jgi:hypothetical protein
MIETPPSIVFETNVQAIRVPIKTEFEAPDPETILRRDQVLIGVLKNSIEANRVAD